MSNTSGPSPNQQAGHSGSPAEDRSPSADGGSGMNREDLETLADKVYQLLLQDLLLDRERGSI